MDTKEIGAALALLKGKAIEQVPAAVEKVLEDHPDWTTTVEDGAITKAKLHEDLVEEIEGNTEDVTALKNAINALPETKESSAEDVDLDFSDANGNVLLRLADGHIHSKNFDSSHIEVETDANISGSTANDVDLDITDVNGNVLLRLSGGHIQTANFNSEDFVKTENVFTVASSGADYTTVRGAVSAAITSGASGDNPYKIQIAPGSYDILSEFTSEEIAEEGFKGLFILDGIYLEGMGVTREQTVLYAEMDTTTYNNEKRNDVSTLNLKGNCGIKNLVVLSTNMRYAVHDDGSFGSASTRSVHIYDNCRIEAFDTTSGGGGFISLGAGCDGSKIFIIKDCDLGDMSHIHTTVGIYPNVVYMYNCRGFAFTASDYASTAVNHYYMFNCDFKWINIHKGSDWVSQHLFLHSDTKGAKVSGYSGLEYETGECCRYQQSQVTTVPVAVAMKNTTRYHIRTATSADETIGVCIHYDSTSGNAIVQHGGWLCAEILGFSNVSVGQYLNVSSDGSLSLSSSDTDAIGRVICSDPNGDHYIKLSI